MTLEDVLAQHQSRFAGGSGWCSCGRWEVAAASLLDMQMLHARQHVTALIREHWHIVERVEATTDEVRIDPVDHLGRRTIRAIGIPEPYHTPDDARSHDAALLSAADVAEAQSHPIVQRAKQALDWITPGARRADDLDVYTLEPLADHGHRIHTIGAFRTPGDAQFDAAAPELVRDLLEEVTTKNEVLDTVLASAGRYRAERDALRANLPDLLGRAWDDGNIQALGGDS